MAEDKTLDTKRLEEKLVKKVRTIEPGQWTTQTRIPTRSIDTYQSQLGSFSILLRQDGIRVQEGNEVYLNLDNKTISEYILQSNVPTIISLYNEVELKVQRYNQEKRPKKLMLL